MYSCYKRQRILHNTGTDHKLPTICRLLLEEGLRTSRIGQSLFVLVEFPAGAQLLVIVLIFTAKPSAIVLFTRRPFLDGCTISYQFVLFPFKRTNIETEPQLQPPLGESLSRRSANAQDDSRVDIRCRGFWCSGQDAFFDVRVFNPLPASNQNTPQLSLSEA